MDIENHKYKQRLVSFYDDVVMDVVHVYFEREILDKDTLFLFLDRNVHNLFHKYISKIECCKCKNKSLAASGKKNPLTEAQFNLLYDCNGNVPQGHEKKIKGNFVQYCLCKVSPKSSVSVLDMDIILICIIIKACCQSYPGNPQWLEDIKNVRNFISHIGDSTSLSENDFNDKWKILELSILEISRITGLSHENSVQKRIDFLKEQHKKMDNLTDAITMCNEISENKILEALRNFGIQIDNLSLHIKKAEFGPTDSKRPRLEEEDQYIPGLKESKCYVTWKFATPGHWNVQEMVTKLSYLSALLDFKVEFVHEGSLVVKTSASVELLYDEKKFTSTLSIFVQRLLKECEVDFSIKDEVEVDIIIEYERKNDTEYISTNCATCEKKEYRLCEKEAEITKLKNELNFQLERAYDTTKLEMGQISLSSLEKSISLDKPLDDFLASWETEEVTRFIESSYSEYSSIEPASPTTDQDKSEESTVPDSTGKVVSDLNDVCSSTDVLEDTKLELPMFSKSFSFDINCEEHISITALANTSNNQIIISNVCSNRLLMFAETGVYLDDCPLIDNPWGLSVSSSVESNQKCNESNLNEYTDEGTFEGVVTLPEQLCYQYFIIDTKGIVPSRAVYADFRCMGIKLTDENVLVGGYDSIHVFNRNDEHIHSIVTDYAVLRIDIYTPMHKRSTENGNEKEPQFLIVLSKEDKLHCSELSTDITSTNEDSRVVLNRYTMSWLSRGRHNESVSCFGVGRHNDIYISSNSLNSIYKFSSTRTTDNLILILDATQDIKEPSALCFSENCEKLCVASNNGKEILIYRNNEYLS